MARISDLEGYNLGRREAIKINTIKDETVLMTADDLKGIMVEYLSEELNFFADGITKKEKSKLQERVTFNLKQIENGMLRHIDDKINSITEKIVSNLTNRVIEEEVNKRVEAKLEKIKKLL